jgi:hypothetical protein
MTAKTNIREIIHYNIRYLPGFLHVTTPPFGLKPGQGGVIVNQSI